MTADSGTLWGEAPCASNCNLVSEFSVEKAVYRQGNGTDGQP